MKPQNIAALHETCNPKSEIPKFFMRFFATACHETGKNVHICRQK